MSDSRGNSTRGSYGAVTVGTSATLIRPLSGSRRNCIIQNEGSADVILGSDSAVTVATGLTLDTGESYVFEEYSGAIWGIVAAGTNDIRFFEAG